MLAELQQDSPGLQIEQVDILTNPGRALRQRVKMIPTLQAGEQRLSGIFLRAAEVRAFIEQVVQAE
ncbi:MAG: hypothetical protein D3910_15090 [Candidatus Electrothrix sp. ATG2]|nr:hypothetical protein [Candidatus Electrothrix sp. ATG2]